MNRRALGFRVRNLVTASVPAITWRVSREQALAGLSAPQRIRVAALEALGHDLEPWGRICGANDWAESLYVLDLWHTLADQGLLDDLPPGRGLDVGSKNGAYLPGLAAAQARGWDAVEIDAHRRYLWGATRRAYGEAKAYALPGCRFVAGDVRDLDGPWAVVTWLLPFLSAAPLAAWGLPDHLLAPRELLAHVIDRMVTDGALVVVNQGPDEAELQRRLFGGFPVAVAEVGPIAPVLSPFRRPRFAFVARRR